MAVHLQSARTHQQGDQLIDTELTRIEARLIEEYTGRIDDCERRIHRVFEAQVRRFADARVRTFLPILIERAVRLELSADR